MKPNKRLSVIISCLIALSLVVAQGSNNRARLGQTHSVSLPASAILEEHAHPVISANGKVGFISSVTAGTVMSFSMTSGRVMSSIVVGESLGPIALIEAGGRRLIAAPAANDPGQGRPATITIIDATSSKRLEVKSILMLPPDALITTGAEAMLTNDGRFCLIPSSFNEPSLLSFNVETGELAARLPLLGRPSEAVLFDDAKTQKIAVVSAVANNLSVIKIDAQGRLASAAEYSPAGVRFDESNNPAFSGDGRSVYIGAGTGDAVFAVDARSGAQLGTVAVDSPGRLTMGSTPEGMEVLAVTRIRRPASNKPGGGVTMLTAQRGKLAVRAEFSPPDDIQFSRANNVALSSDAAVGFVGSATGMLFAFDAETGELESYHPAGGELRRVALSEKARAVAAVRSSSLGDQIVIASFEADSAGGGTAGPSITGLVPSTVEQGRLKNLTLTVIGSNFTDGSSLLVNGTEAAAELVRGGKALQARLPRSLFDQPGAIGIQVKAAAGGVSNQATLAVVRPNTPVIGKIKPSEAPGPGGGFTLTVTGQNFRPTSTIFVGDRALATTRPGNNELQAQVPANLVRVGQLTVLVKDLVLTDLISNPENLLVFGPRVKRVSPSINAVVAGAGGFRLRIEGSNFRDGAHVEINGSTLDAALVSISSATLIRAHVPKEATQEAGNLSVVVRNPDGSASDPKQLAALPPVITSLNPTQLVAGQSNARVDINGENFRRHARVYAGNASGAFRVSTQHVRFRSHKLMVVELTGDFNNVLTQPGSISFKVVNPNGADGVPSADQTIPLVAPKITDAVVNAIKNDPKQVRLTIDGQNFRNGAIIEFVKDGAVVRQDSPEKTKDTIITLVIAARKVAALGSYQVRVVNPGNVASDPIAPSDAGQASSEE